MVFIHRFGALLNTPLHYHCIVVDGVFDADAVGGVVFHPASGLNALAIREVQAAVRRRLLRAVERRGLLSPEDARIMAAWEHGGGFSVNAEVRIEAHERDGLERLLRYCARPAAAPPSASLHRGAGVELEAHGPRSPRWRSRPVKPMLRRLPIQSCTPDHPRRPRRRQTSRRIAKRHTNV
ncbi:MAG: transposase [Candidatus Nitrotoga sp.]